MSARDRLTRILKLRGVNQDIVELEDNSAAGAGPTMELRDDQFYIVDPTTVTKRIRFDAGGVPAATDVVLSVTDSGLTSSGRKTIVDTGGVFATPIVLTAADSGKVYLLDDAAGLDFTLPALGATTAGIYYGFRVTVTNTSNSYRLTAGTGDIINGHVLTSDFDAAYTAPQILAAEGGGSVLVMTLAAIAQGGGINGWFEIEALSANMWFVRGNLIGDGTIVTPFS